MATTVIVMRSVFLLVLLAVVNSQSVHDTLGVELHQDELIDEELEELEPILANEDSLAEDTFPDGFKNVDEKLTLATSNSKLYLKTVSNVNATFSDSEEDDAKHETAFATSFFVTTISELGDKTFFMSAILAMHHSRTLTLIGATIGQTIMTLVAVVFGMAASLIPDIYTQWASAVIMTFFGLKMLRDSSEMDDSPDGKSGALQATNEAQEKSNETITEQDEQKKEETDENDNKNVTKESAENNNEEKNLDSKKNGIVRMNSKNTNKPPEYTKGVLVQAMTLCLMGEWGDKSQIATILLASNEDPYVVAAGGILGHILCNIIAVFGGRMIASKFPAKLVTQLGGVFFLFAAVSSFVFS